MQAAGIVDEDPTVDPKFEEGPEHDVVARCPNGKIRGRSSAPIYVIMRVDMENPDEIDADVIAYSYENDLGSRFVETIAARDTFGKFWDFGAHGSPCFDPFRDDGSQRDFPPGRFMMWDEPEDEAPECPRSTISSLTIYDGDAPGKPRAIRRYKVCLAQPTINDYIAMETEGDKLFL